MAKKLLANIQLHLWLLLILAFAPCEFTFSQLPPTLPTQPYNYVDYATTNLPLHFRTGDVAGTDNTPEDLSLIHI